MGWDHGPGRRPDLIARQLADAVENLVTLWFSAAEDLSPRISSRQLLALQTVRRRPELNLTALAEGLGIGLPMASRLCDRLEAAGLLQRSVQPHNRREVRLVVTPHGRRLLTDVTERRSRRLAAVIEAMTPGERASFLGGMHAFHQAQVLGRVRPARDGRERPDGD
ncbi:MarR family winged helix-turn-helix transcriptional regulator [Streptomyces fructofermentans]|nr:MarR family winged helix-turn-helix transcriptional regulator [Streptomyces fructofermentans]